MEPLRLLGCKAIGWNWEGRVIKSLSNWMLRTEKREHKK